MENVVFNDAHVNSVSVSPKLGKSAWVYGVDRLTLAQHHQDIPVHIVNKPDAFCEYIEIKARSVGN